MYSSFATSFALLCVVISYSTGLQYMHCRNVEGLSFHDYVVLATEGSTVSIPCNISNANTVIRHTKELHKDDRLVENYNVSVNNNTDRISFDNNVFTLRNYTEQIDQGPYRCTNDNGDNKCTYVISEKYLCHRTYRVSVHEGSTVSYRCASIQNQGIIGFCGTWIYIDSNNTLHKVVKQTSRCVLHIENIQPGEAGRYMCENMNKEIYMYDIEVMSIL